MQNFLLRAPSWVIGVIAGAVFAVGMGIMGWVKDTSGTFVAISAGVGGLIVGLTVALAIRAPRREQLRALEHLPVADWKQVRRAAWRGPVPSDARIRDAALDLARRIFARAHRYRKLLYIVVGLNLVVAIVRVVLEGPGWYVITIFLWAAVIFSHWYNLRRLERRIELLSGTPAERRTDHGGSSQGR